MKHDGSLDEGLEIVTHPCSLAYHTYQFRWAEVMRVCKSHGFKSHDTSTCGLHIHVGRLQMGETDTERHATAGKLVLLVNAVWPELVTFTRRSECKLERWAQRNCIPAKADLEGMRDGHLLEIAYGTRHDGRYQAVNLRNSETVEFRVFRGTLNRSTLIASLQLVNNMVKFAMSHTPTECLNATWAEVVNTAEFKELKAYCEKHDIPA